MQAMEQTVIISMRDVIDQYNTDSAQEFYAFIPLEELIAYAIEHPAGNLAVLIQYIFDILEDRINELESCTVDVISVEILIEAIYSQVQQTIALYLPQVHQLIVNDIISGETFILTAMV